MKKLLLIIIAILLWASPCLGTTYIRYVDADITDRNSESATGDCATPGTYDESTETCGGGSSTVYATIADVNAFLASLGSSDTAYVYFNKDDTWVVSNANKRLGYNNSSGPINFAGSGSGSISLYFDRYGSGSSDPQIYSTVSCSGANYAIVAIYDNAGQCDVDNVSIQHLSLTGNSTSIRCNGVDIRYVSGNITYAYNELDHNGTDDAEPDWNDELTGLRTRWDVCGSTGNIEYHHNTIYDMTETGSPESGVWDAHGIMIGSIASTLKTVGTVSVHDNTIHEVNGDCMQFQNIALTGTYAEVYNNTCYKFGENAIDFKASNNFKVYKNVIYRAISPDTWGLGGSGSSGAAIVWSEGRAGIDTQIYNNYFNENIQMGAIRTNHALDGQVIKVFNNYFKDNPTVLYQARAIVKFHDNVIYNTKGQGNSGTSYTNSSLVFYSPDETHLGPESGTEVSHNTFWHQPTDVSNNYDCVVYFRDGTVDLNNNILYLNFSDSGTYPATPLYVNEGVRGEHALTVDSNNYYNAANTNRVYWYGDSAPGPAYDSSEEEDFQSAHDSGAVFSDPSFSSFPKLNSGSPCKDTASDTSSNMLDWDDCVWTPAASISVIVMSDNNMGAVGYEDSPPGAGANYLYRIVGGAP